MLLPCNTLYPLKKKTAPHGEKSTNFKKPCGAISRDKEYKWHWCFLSFSIYETKFCLSTFFYPLDGIVIKTEINAMPPNTIRGTAKKNNPSFFSASPNEPKPWYLVFSLDTIMSISKINYYSHKSKPTATWPAMSKSSSSGGLS